ncbi:chemotaxis protein CheW [Chelatococcus sp. SYSU_G07232]|uniref:Chemotaxis protein CheW n=1 Tax=Chelatococcus albus TaxID=3047466 RepID=A0ABT7AF99_9HYPH|nr:chemotaxis protein CheW [Chelatococcus sp. SYSU_G07232]MDJ1158046.1 chemotaxis protein CheW [Chelatococcus sp. SYSU_G07232]
MTQALNMTETSPSAGSDASRRIVTFCVDERTFGIDVQTVREIKGWQETTPLPHAAPYVRGVVNLRGVILPVYDLRARIGLGTTQATAAHVIVVVDIADRTAGILVDTVSDIVDVPASAIRPTPDVERDHSGLIEHLALLDNEIVALLDLAAITQDGIVEDASSRHANAA